MLVFTLDAPTPAGASITSAGAFTWTPAEAGTDTIIIRVTDNGVMPLGDSKTITVEVPDAPGFTNTLRNGDTVELTWGARRKELCGGLQK